MCPKGNFCQVDFLKFCTEVAKMFLEQSSPKKGFASLTASKNWILTISLRGYTVLPGELLYQKLLRDPRVKVHQQPRPLSEGSTIQIKIINMPKWL